MPTYCGQQLAPALRSSYDLSLLDSSGRPLDICAVFCGSAEQCTVDAALLPRLDVLHQLHDEGSTLWALAAQGNGNGNGSRSGSGSGGSEGGNGSGNGSGGDGSGSSGGNSGDGGGDDDSAGGQQGNATTAGSPAAAPAADDDGGSGVNVAAVAAGTVAGTGELLLCHCWPANACRTAAKCLLQALVCLVVLVCASSAAHLRAVALALAGFAVWRMRRRRRQPAAAAAAAADEADDHGKPGPDLEAGWAAGQGKSPQDKKQQQQQQQHQQQQRSDVDSAASTPSSSPAAASTQEAAPDGLEGLAALWAQAAQAAAPAAAAGATGAAGAAAAGTAAGRQPQDSAWRGDQPGRDRRASGAAEAAGGSSPDVTAGSSELTAPSTPAGELQRGASRRGSQGMSGTTSAAMDLERWEVDFSAISLLRLLGEGSCGSVYLATLNETAVAVKLLAGADPAAASAGSWRSSPALQALHKESSLMAALRHPNVVSAVARLRWLAGAVRSSARCFSGRPLCAGLACQWLHVFPKRLMSRLLQVMFLGISYEPPAIISGAAHFAINCQLGCSLYCAASYSLQPQPCPPQSLGRTADLPTSAYRRVLRSRLAVRRAAFSQLQRGDRC